MKLIGTFMIAALVGCAATTAAGKCEVSAITQTVKSQSGADISIVTDIVAAIESGGATLPALLTQLKITFGPQTSACAQQLADSLESDILTLIAPKGSAVAVDEDVAQLTSGIKTLHAEMDKRHLKHR